MRLPRRLALSLALAATLAACSPHYDWRDYRDKEAPYAVLFPGKPASQSRTIKLGQIEVDLSMTAAEVDGVIFAVGAAQLADAAQAPAALRDMQAALVKNIGATVTKSETKPAGGGQPGMLEVDIEARGSQQGQPMRLSGRFIAKDRRIYQVVVMGREQAIVADTVETYLSSFKLN